MCLSSHLEDVSHRTGELVQVVRVWRLVSQGLPAVCSICCVCANPGMDGSAAETDGST